MLTNVSAPKKPTMSAELLSTNDDNTVLLATLTYSVGTLTNAKALAQSPQYYLVTSGVGADRLGFSRERMLAGEASAEAGRVRPLADVLNELRARNR